MADPVWKGDANNLAAKAAWQASYEPGYKPVVISPRDSNGAYDSKGTIFTVLTQKEQAQEIAVALQKEGVPVPKGIVDTLKAKLGITSNDVKKTAPPTAIIGNAAGAEGISNRSLINKYTDGLKTDPNTVGVILIIIMVIVLFIMKKK